MCKESKKGYYLLFPPAWIIKVSSLMADTSPGGGGLPYEMDGDARRLAWGCKFRILVSLRVLWAKCHYL